MGSPYAGDIVQFKLISESTTTTKKGDVGTRSKMGSALEIGQMQPQRTRM